MATTAASDLSDGPVLSLINKRLRALRKKQNRILQMEESLAQGKPLNREQEDVLRSKPGVISLIDELEKLRQPLSAAVQEEIALARNADRPVSDNDGAAGVSKAEEKEKETGVIEDLLHLLYFGSLFDVKPQSEYTSTMLTRTHERGCCLTYDYVTDDATDLLGERDLDSISVLGGLLTSRPVNSSLSHKNSLERCIEHAKLWISKSDRPIEPESPITYAGLRERLDKIMASYYFTTTPEIKAPVEMAAAAAAGNYASFQMPVEPVVVPVQVEGSVLQYQEKGEDAGHESGNNISIPVEEEHKDESETENPEQEQEQVKPQVEVEQNLREVESEEQQQQQQQQYNNRRTYQNQRGARGGNGSGRRGYYSNGRGGGGGGSRNGGRGGGAYQNGRNQYYDQPPNYYPRNYSNYRGRGGRGGGGGQSNYNHGSAVQPADVKLAS